VLLYKLSFDRFPFRGRDEFELLKKIAKTKLVFSERSNLDLKNLLEKMLMRNPGQRLSIS
jgi:serine/threonine protein kinase